MTLRNRADFIGSTAFFTQESCFCGINATEYCMMEYMYNEYTSDKATVRNISILPETGVTKIYSIKYRGRVLMIIELDSKSRMVNYIEATYVYGHAAALLNTYRERIIRRFTKQPEQETEADRLALRLINYSEKSDSMERQLSLALTSMIRMPSVNGLEEQRRRGIIWS